MKAIEIIDALLSGWNDIEQMGIFNSERGIEFFGKHAIIVQGSIEEGCNYVYIYEEMLKGSQKTYICNCRIRDKEGCEIRLYKIED